MSRQRFPKYVRELHALRPDSESELSAVEQITQHVDRATRKHPFFINGFGSQHLLLAQAGRVLVKDVPIEGATEFKTQHGFMPEDASAAFVLAARALHERVSSPLVDRANLISSVPSRPDAMDAETEDALRMVTGERPSTPVAMGYLMLSTMEHYADGEPDYATNRELWVSPALDALSALGLPDLRVED